MIRLFRFLKPYRWAVVLVLGLIFLQSLSDLYLPTLMADIVDKGIVKEDHGYIWRIGGLMLLVSAASGTFAIIASYHSSKIASGFGRMLRSRMFKHVEGFSLQEFDKFGTASLITRTTNDINQVQQVLLMMMRMMVSAPMMCIGGTIMAVTKDPGLSLTIVGVIPVLALTIYMVARKGIPLFKVIQSKIDKLNLVLRENLSGVRVIRAFNRAEHERKRFDAANLDLTDVSVKVNKIMAAMMPLMMLIVNLTSIAIIWFGSIRIDAGHMQVGDLMAFLQYAMQIMFSLIMVSMMFVMVPRASASAARILHVLDTEPVIRDRAEAHAPRGQGGHVVFEQVTFSYPGAEKPAISNITFEAKPGETTAIIGGTGSGKSTLVNLIARFYDIDSGSIKVDGSDVRELTQESLRKKLGFVPQQAVLFTGSVKENIAYGKEDATIEEIRDAARIAQASGFIEEKPEGYDAVISQGGTNLSGGQKQRLSIARALVRRPDIYIFDDTFSALDYRTDANLRAALKKETSGATVIIVAQRVSTVMDADRIIVLDDGEIVGIGNHRELMAASEIYREIVSSQLAEEEIA